MRFIQWRVLSNARIVGVLWLPVDPKEGINTTFTTSVEIESVGKARVNVDKAHEELLELLQTIRPRDDLMKVISRKIELDWQNKLQSLRHSAIKKSNCRAEKEELRAIPPSVRASFYTEEFAKEEAERINAEIAVLGLNKTI